MKRRTYLKTIGTATSVSVVGLAGCGGPGGGAEGSPEEGSPDDEALTPDPPGTEPGTETMAGGAGGGQTETTAGGAVGETETDGAATGTAGTATGTAGGATTTVEMWTEGQEYYFDPIGLFVEPGTEITWVNSAGAHSSTAYDESIGAAETTRIPDDAEPWNSGILNQEGAEFTHAPEVTGTYDYFCIPHKTLGMIGRLVVGEPGGPADEGSPPDGELPDPQRIVDEGAVAWEDFDGG